jgi:hypothetical protein
MARVYKAVFNCSLTDGSLILPTLHYQTDLSFIGDEPSPTSVAGGISTLLQAAFRACIPSAVTLHAISVTEEVIKPAVATGGSVNVELGGTLAAGSGNSLPNGCTVLINRHTETRSRSARGWFHMPCPINSSHVNGNNWGASITTPCNSLAGLLDDSFDLGTVDITHVHPVVYSRTRHQRGQEPYTFRVVNASVNPKVKWLRSRMSSP